jgi:hypothetical protein
VASPFRLFWIAFKSAKNHTMVEAELLLTVDKNIDFQNYKLKTT